ncbi:hypothetical protein [Helicobacter salomonis]|uniref:hypothetical protein n=1 Tax=Helicobacter salomonis TaxID=56878 RepID=UPI000CF18B75|nr:hypothetical protein [Helicobacter salomonis]
MQWLGFLGEGAANPASALGKVGAGVGLGLQGVGLLMGGVSLGTQIWSTNEQIRRSKEAMKLARAQFMEENRRYNAREKERLEANATIGQAAQGYDLNTTPMALNSAPMLRE